MGKFMISLVLVTVTACVCVVGFSVLVMLAFKAIAFAYEKIFGNPLE